MRFFKLPRTGLHAWLLALVGVSVAPALALIIVLGLERREAARDSAQAQNQAVAREVAGRYAEVREGVHQLLAGIARLPIAEGSDCSQPLRQLAADLPQYHNIGIADDQGNVLCSALASKPGSSIADRQFFKDAITSGSFTEGTFQLGLITGLPSIGFALPVRVDDRYRVGVATLDLAWLARAVAGLELPDGAQVWLIDRKGTVLAAYPESEGAPGESVQGTNLFGRLASGDSSSYETSELGSTRLLFAFSSVGGEQDGAYIAIGYPTALAHGPANAEFQRNVMLLVAVALGAMIAAWLLGNSVLLRPIRNLLAASRMIEKGEFEVRSVPQPLSVELGELAESFTTMATRLEERDRTLRSDREALRQTSTELQRRVMQLNGLHEAFGKMMLRLSVEDVARIALEEAMRLSQADSAVLRIVREDRLEVAAFLHSEDAHELSLKPVSIGEGLMGRVAALRQPLRIDRSAELQMSDGQHVPGAESGICVPIMIGERLLGTVACWSRRPAGFDAEDQQTLLLLSSQLATAIVAAESAESTEQRARTDALTGLFNRLQLREDFGPDGSMADMPAYSVVMFDIDNFKECNDLFGHEFGDLVLQAVATTAKGNVREGDKLYRFGGEEFLAVLPLCDGAAAEALARRLGSAIAATSVGAQSVTVSLGIAVVPADCLDFPTALRLADQAMYESKRQGRARTTRWSANHATAA